MPSYLKKYGAAATRKPAHFEPASQPQKDIFLRRYRDGDTAGEARKKAGITWAQFKHALASDPDFLQANEEVDEFFLDKLEEVARSMAHNKDGAMVRWILEKRRPEKYGQRAKVEVSHRFASHDDIKKLSDEDILATFEELGIEVES